MSQKPTAEDILSAYRPDKKPVEVKLPTGETMTFRPITSSKERRDLIARVAAFIAAVPDRRSSAFKGHALEKVWPKDIEDQSSSLILHFRAIDPPISQETAFALHDAPELLSYIETELARADKEVDAIARERLLEAARGKSRTPGKGGGSSPASEPSQGETPNP